MLFQLETSGVAKHSARDLIADIAAHRKTLVLQYPGVAADAQFRSVSELCFSVSSQTKQLPGAEEALRINPVRYSQDAFVEDDTVYVKGATGMLGLLRSSAYLQQNCEVACYNNEKRPFTLHRATSGTS